jgi:hypothetical protein
MSGTAIARFSLFLRDYQDVYHVIEWLLLLTYNMKGTNVKLIILNVLFLCYQQIL